MPKIEPPSPKAMVYQFSMYDIKNDEMRPSARWGTREKITEIGGFIAEDQVREIEAYYLRSPYTDITGLTAIGFTPDKPDLPQKVVR